MGSSPIQPQTVGNVDTEEIDWDSELRQILVSRITGNLGTSLDLSGKRVNQALMSLTRVCTCSFWQGWINERSCERTKWLER